MKKNFRSSAGSVLHGLRKSLRRKGLRGTALLSVEKLYVLLRTGRLTGTTDPEIFEFDRTNGLDTAQGRLLKDLGVTDPAAEEAVDYQPSPVGIVREILTWLPPPLSRFSFLDIGCGKGLVLFLAAAAGFQHLIGVDLSQELLSIASANWKLLGFGEKATLELLCQDAASVKLPDSPLVVYLFNPFGPGVMKRFMDNLEGSLKDNPRPVFVCYYLPVHHGVIDRSESLDLMRKEVDYRIYASPEAMALSRGHAAHA